MLNKILALAVCLVFLFLAFWHFYMATGLSKSENGAVPSVNGKPLFVPSRPSTIAIGVVLILFALLVLATAGMVSTGLPLNWLRWAMYALALGLVARAVGEFKYVGFFKRVRGTPFARMDTLVYSPLCLLMGAGVAVIAFRQSAG
jgi:hypothetical protein